MEFEPLRDGHGRLIGDLRVSVTDRCNLRCLSTARRGPAVARPPEILTFEEITRLVAAAAMGVNECG